MLTSNFKANIGLNVFPKQSTLMYFENLKCLLQNILSQMPVKK